MDFECNDFECNDWDLYQLSTVCSVRYAIKCQSLPCFDGLNLGDLTI